MAENCSPACENVTISVNSCAICSSTSNLKRCSRCRVVYYCSREHQKQAWSEHRRLCQQLALNSERGAAAVTEVKRCSTSENSRSSNSVQNVEQGKCEEEKVIKGIQNSHVNMTEDEKAEIEGILDFDSLKMKENAQCLQNANTDSGETEPESKDIFQNLLESEQQDYCGPSGHILVNESVEAIQDSAEFIDETLSTNISEEQQSQADATSPEDASDDFEPFDDRPLRKLKFPKPESYDHKDLAEFICIRLINLGYCVVDGVFEDEVINGIVSEIKELGDKNELKTGQLAGGKTSGVDSKKVTETNIRSDKIKWIQGDEEGVQNVSLALATMDSIMTFINISYMKDYGKIQGRTKAMLACYPGNGTFYRRHVDNPDKDGRRITCILYLNKDWDVQRDGGLLRILPPKQVRPVDIPPLANRLLFFWSDRRNPHEVQPAFRERFAMTVWYFDTEERETAKIEQLKQETDEINMKIAELEEKKRQMQEMTAAQQVQNKAMEAVKSLSQQELEAISLLVQVHPEPKEVLTAMGISSVIQDALISFLTNSP